MHRPHEDKWVYLTTQNSFQRAQIAGNVKSTQTFYCELTRYHSSGHLSLADLVWPCMNSFPSKHKRSFLNYLFIFSAIQHFQKHQLPPPSRPVLFHEDRRDIRGPDQNPVQRSATPSVRVEDVVTIYYGWQHICQDTVQHLRKDRSRRKSTLARLTTLT